MPGILEVNSPLIREQRMYRSLIHVADAKSIRAQCFKNANSIIAVSDEVAEQLRTNYFASEKTTVVPNGVNCSRFQPPENSQPVHSDKLSIGFLGTLKPWHGVSILLDAFARVRSLNPKVQLKIVGDGPERENLDSRLQRFSSDIRQSVQWIRRCSRRAGAGSTVFI